MGQALLKLFGEVVGVVQVSLQLRRSIINVGACHAHIRLSCNHGRELLLSESYGGQTASICQLQLPAVTCCCWAARFINYLSKGLTRC